MRITQTLLGKMDQIDWASCPIDGDKTEMFGSGRALNHSGRSILHGYASNKDNAVGQA